MNKFKFYFITVIILGVVFLALVAMVNFIIDPYDMYRAIDIKGLNKIKPAIYNRVRLLKAYEIRRVEPEGLLLGTSRYHLGFDPESPQWRTQALPRYNAAFDGATTKEMYYYLRHAQAVNPLKEVVLGLDTYHPTESPGFVRPGFDESVLFDNDSFMAFLEVWINDLRILTSWDTLKDSWRTVFSQKAGEPRWLKESGQRSGKLFFRRPDENYMKFGPRYYFDEIDKLEVGFKLEWKIPAPKMPKIYPPPVAPKADPLTSMDYIRKIIKFCVQNNIKLTVLFSPSHVHQLEIERITNGWWSLHNAKRKVVEILSTQNYENIPLWDFSGYSEITTEKLPPVDSFREMKYYWDSSHFKEKVGDMVFERMFNSDADSSFGVRLTEENVESHIQNMEEEGRSYRVQHSEAISRFKAWVQQYKEEHDIKD